jgi:hypothetical protein
MANILVPNCTSYVSVEQVCTKLTTARAAWRGSDGCNHENCHVM